MRAQWKLRCEAKYQCKAVTLHDHVALWLSVLEGWRGERNMSCNRADLQHLIMRLHGLCESKTIFIRFILTPTGNFLHNTRLTKSRFHLGRYNLPNTRHTSGPCRASGGHFHPRRVQVQHPRGTFRIHWPPSWRQFLMQLPWDGPAINQVTPPKYPHPVQNRRMVSQVQFIPKKTRSAKPPRSAARVGGGGGKRPLPPAGPLITP